MPGFGSGPFGHGSFGEYAWGKSVLFGLAPDHYREVDAAGLYEAFAEGQAESFDRLRRKIRDFGDLRDPLRVRARDDQEVILRLGAKQEVLGEIEQSGISATVNSGGALVTDSGRGRFTFADIGKLVFVERSSIPGNNRSAVVVGLVDEHTVAVSPQLVEDTGPLRWALRAVEESTTDTSAYEVVGGSVESILLGCLLSDGYAEVQISGREQFPASVVDKNLYTEREGNDGYFDGGRFLSPTAVFTVHDKGKRLLVSGSVHAENNARFEISQVYDDDEVALDFEEAVDDPGPLTWAVMHRARLTVDGDTVLRGVAEQQGADGEVLASPSRFRSATADFTAADVGKLVTLRRISGWEGGESTHEILTINSRTEVVLDASFGGSTSGFLWEVRARTLIGDGTQVVVRAHPLLPLLARDYGVEVDTEDSEEFQRRWVASVSRWTPLKASTDGYEFVAALTGFDLTVSALFRVSQVIYESLDTGFQLAVGEPDVGRSGTNGALSVVGSAYRFSSATGVFTYNDIGLQIEVADSGAGNNGLRTIAAVLSATEVEFRAVDTASAETGLTWRIVRLYSTQGPRLPVYDEINADLMTDLKGSSAFSVDMYCFEPDWDTKIGVGGDGVFSVTAVSPSTPSPTPIFITVTAKGDVNVAVGLGVGRWKMTDSGGTSFFLESVPTELVAVAAGRAGVDGELTGGATFEAATAVFTSADVGRHILLEDSLSGNNGLHRISVYTSPTIVQLADPPYAPDDNNGSLTWALVDWQFTVVATTPPALGNGTLEYVCSETTETCDFCKSYRVLVSGQSNLEMSDPLGRLADRLEQAKAMHVDFVWDVGMAAVAPVEISVVVETP